MCVRRRFCLKHEELRWLLPGLGESLFSSTNGQTELDASKQSFRMVMPGAECFLLPSQMNAIQGAQVAVSGNKTVSTCFVAGLDSRPLKGSRRMLALCITDLKNTGTVMDYEKPGGSLPEDGRCALPPPPRGGGLLREHGCNGASAGMGIEI